MNKTFFMHTLGIKRSFNYILTFRINQTLYISDILFSNLQNHQKFFYVIEHYDKKYLVYISTRCSSYNLTHIRSNGFNIHQNVLIFQGINRLLQFEIFSPPPASPVEHAPVMNNSNSILSIYACAQMYIVMNRWWPLLSATNN